MTNKKAGTMGAKFITLDADEFNEVCQRVHGMLVTRANKAWQKHQMTQTDKSSNVHIETSKDAFAFIHLLELVEHMTEEIHELRMMTSSDNEQEFVYTGEPMKRYLN